MRSPLIIMLVSLLFVAACNDPTQSTEILVSVMTLDVKTSKINDPTEFKAVGQYHNGNEHPVTLDKNIADVPALTLEVRRLHGENAPHLPPPVPQEPQPLILEPGDNFEVEIKGLAIDPQLLGKGRFEVRWVLPLLDGGETVMSDWTAFEIM